MSEMVFVARGDEITAGDRKIIDVGDTSIGVFNIDGEYYALENQCAHQGGPVCTGKQQGAIVGEFSGPGERVHDRFDEDNPVIACPWHGFEYEIKTGEHVGDPTVSIPTYPVNIEADKIYLELDVESSSPASPG